MADGEPRADDQPAKHFPGIGTERAVIGQMEPRLKPIDRLSEGEFGALPVACRHNHEWQHRINRVAEGQAGVSGWFQNRFDGRMRGAMDVISRYPGGVAAHRFKITLHCPREILGMGFGVKIDGMNQSHFEI